MSDSVRLRGCCRSILVQRVLRVGRCVEASAVELGQGSLQRSYIARSSSSAASVVIGDICVLLEIAVLVLR